MKRLEIYLLKMKSKGGGTDWFIEKSAEQMSILYHVCAEAADGGRVFNVG